MNRSLLFIGIILSTTIVQEAYGQAPSITPSVLNASGGSSSALGTFIIDYSIGEMTLVSTAYEDTLVVTQGLLQNDLSIPEKTPVITLKNQLQVFPNPASSIININYTSQQTGTLSYRLLDVTGQEVMKNEQTINSGLTKEILNISSLAAATYMLEVTFKSEGSGDQSASYKIEKLK